MARIGIIIPDEMRDQLEEIAQEQSITSDRGEFG